MAEESTSGGERTEAPSAKRRQDFRNKGQVAQSKEVHTAALFTVTLVFWFFYLPRFLHGITDFISAIWQSSCQFNITPASIIKLSAFMFKDLFLLMFPLFLTVLIVGFLSSFLQFGWLLTGKPLTPDFSKMNPIKGMGRLFSKRSLVELVKSLTKVVLIAWIAYSTVIDNLPEAFLLIDTTVITTLVFLGKTAALILAKVCGLLILIAFLDFLFVRWEMEQKMKMTKQELKEEYKESEGDPMIKSQIRAIQQDMARKRMMAEVPEADVIITNPTHFSVAVKYDSAEMQAPTIIAKGADLIALKIREIAKDHDVPIIENPPVARLLHKLEVGTTIPESLFKAVAQILAHVYSLKGNKS